MKSYSTQKKSAINESQKIKVSDNISVAKGASDDEIIIADKNQAISVTKEEASKLVEALKGMI
jgi:hypothetical protein